MSTTDNLQFIVRRDERVVATFNKRSHATEWAQARSWSDESSFTVHDAEGVVIETFRDGEPESGVS